MSERPVPYWTGNVCRVWFRSEGGWLTGPDPEPPYGTPRPPALAPVIPFPRPDTEAGRDERGTPGG